MTVPPQQRMDSPRQFRRPAGPPYPEDPTTATRHLCAGAYLDDTFRNDSLRQVYYQPRRVVAPSYGFDVVPVLAHCLRARNGAIIRDCLILATVLVSACISPTAIVMALVTMAQLQLTVGTWRLVRETIRRVRDAEPIALGALAARTFLLIAGWVLVGVVGVASSVALIKGFTESLTTTGGLGDAGAATVALVYGSILLCLLIFCYPVAFSLWRQTAPGKMAPGLLVPQPVRNARLDEIGRQQRGNPTVYSGFKPYV